MTNPTESHTIAMLTAGAGGMYCGSCIHDNALAAALQRQSVDAVLVPTYTPIQTDENSVSIDQVFFGGINVYLQQKLPWLRYLPGWMDRWLDNPGLLLWVTSRAMETDASQLGDLTLSMLRGEHGRQRKEVERLAHWMANELRPQLIVFSNILIAGSSSALKKAVGGPILITLQGDDVFLKDLPDDVRQEAIVEIGKIAAHVDGFLTHSEFYADFMSEFLSLPRDKFHVVPLGLDTSEYESLPMQRPSDRPPTVGYLARMAPEKGLHILCQAFDELKSREATKDAILRVAGWVGNGKQYADECLRPIRDKYGELCVRFEPDIKRADKLDFLQGIDVLSVPCTWKEPKGIYVLEALAAGVPVVQPAHGAFPELIESVGGGRLFPPGDNAALSDHLFELLSNDELRGQLSVEGRVNVLSKHSSEAAARATYEVYSRFLT